MSKDFPAGKSGPDERTDIGRLYGRRLGRPLKAARQSAIDAWLPRIGVTLPAEPASLDPVSLFAAPVTEAWLEVGFGGGEHLLAQAAAHPHAGLIGCEPFINGMAALLRAIDEEPSRAANVRLLMDDARLLIAALPEASIARAFVLFPDPWPKARHHKRRFVSRANLDQLARVLQDGAELRLATDDPGYLQWMLVEMTDHPAFRWTARRPADWRQRPADSPKTRYETKGLAGAAPAFMTWRRRPR
ncbi:MAG TPA: tRNA (guanine(46)-N(7))-methyltransferase TrmB [Alphaproteobacteria bacterium]|jgi:tRNA (guanine-N7-)-methyltransferase